LDKNIYKAGLESDVELDSKLCLTLFKQASESVRPRIIEKALAGLLSREKDPSKLISLIYETTVMGLESEDDKLTNYLLKVLNYDTDVLEPNSSLAVRYSSNILSPNDISLKQFLDLDFFSDLLPIYFHPEINERLIEIKKGANNVVIPNVLEVIGDVDNLDKNSRERILKLLLFFEIQHRDKISLSPEEVSQFPYNLLSKGSRLLEITHQIYLDISGNKDEEIIKVPGEYANLFDTYVVEEASVYFYHTIIDAINNYQGNERNFDILEMRTVINLLGPEINSDEFEDLSNLIVQKRDKISLEPKRSISTHGTEIIISDPELLKLGYRSIIFSYTDKKPNMNVIIKFGENKFKLPLILDYKKRLKDERGEPLEGGKVKADKLPSAWIEAIVLCHLSEYICTEASFQSNKGGYRISIDELIEGAQENSFTSRVGHLRRLSINEHFSEEQVKLAMDEQGWDLREINMQRKEKGLGEVTYVKIVDQLPLGISKKPDKFKSRMAMNDLNNILL